MNINIEQEQHKKEYNTIIIKSMYTNFTFQKKISTNLVWSLGYFFTRI